MKDLHPQFELLIRFADGNADSDMQRQALELIRSDAEAADFYQSLQATSPAQVPYHALYADARVTDATPDDVPAALIEQINQATASDYSDAHDSAVSSDHLSQQPSQNTAVPSGQVAANSNRFGPLAMAASLAFGLIAGALLYRTSAPSASDTTVATAPQAVPEWIRLVADYHRLYVRDTVTATAAASAGEVSQQVSETLQTPFSVPSLESQGMQFRRAQWLAIDEQPLLQLAYLPDNGKPLAVCVLKKDIAEDKPAEYGETGGMQYVHWQRGEHAVVIVGTVSPDRLQDINGIIERELL